MDRCGTRGQSGHADAAEHSGPDYLTYNSHTTNNFCARDSALAGTALPGKAQRAGEEEEEGWHSAWLRGLFPPCDTGAMSWVCVTSEPAEEASAPSPQLLMNRLHNTGASIEPWGLHQ